MRRRTNKPRDVKPRPAVAPKLGWQLNCHPNSGAARPAVAALYGERLRPWLLGAMTALFVARPLFPSESAATYGDGLTIVMLWIVLAAFWLLGAIGQTTFSLRFGWVDVFVLLLVGWHSVAALWAVATGTPRPAVNMLWEWVGIGLSYLLARQLIATAREARAVAAVMVALAVALSGYGLYQYVYEMPRTRAMYEADPDRALRAAGLDYPPGSPERQLFANRLYSSEPPATFALTNSLAGFLSPWFVVLAGISLVAVRNRRRLLGMVLCMVPIAVCLLLTKSRSGYVAAGMGLLLVWLPWRAKNLRIGWKIPAAVALALAMLIATLVATGGLDREVLSQASQSLGYRLQYWQSSLRMIADHPIVGCGPGNFQNAYTRYKLSEASEEITDPHNFLLEILATAGTPAALAFLAVLGAFAWAVWRDQGSGVGGQGSESTEPEIRPPPSALRPPPSADAWAHVLVGGACAFLLSVPVGLLSAAPPGIAAVWLGLPLAAATIMLMLGWVREGPMPRWLPAIAVAVLLTNLLAAGGIGLPGVAGTLWLLLALGLHGEPPRVLPIFGAWAGLLVTLALAVTCYATAYRPVLNCQANLRKAERDPAHAVEYLRAAAAADPLSAEPWRRLAAVELGTWWERPSDEGLRRFEQACHEAVRLAPNSASDWATIGDLYARLSSKTDPQGRPFVGHAAQAAADAYRQAVELYPNSAVYRAELAEAYQTLADEPAFRREAAAALRLDGLTPHLDKKLPADLRQRLLKGLGEE